MKKIRISLVCAMLLLLPTVFLGVPAEAGDHRFERRQVWVQQDRIPRVVVMPGAVTPWEWRPVNSWGRPPGWDRGRKTGWGACGVPPGLAKKAGCGWTVFGNARSRPRRSPVIVIPIP